MADKSGTRYKSTAVLERGDIYFVYRPKVEREDVGGVGDVQRIFMVLEPEEKQRYRIVTLGRKRLPDIRDGGQRIWGFVAKIAGRPEAVREELGREVYRTKTRGEREQPGVRPAGEGRYAIVRHDDHTHLMYQLELPRKPGEVQEELNIEPEASYILSVKNPDTPSPPQAGLSGEQQAEFPRKLRERFGRRKFIALDPPDFLDHEGAEVLLVGAKEDASEELGLELDTERESEQTAEVFNELKLRKADKTRTPLFQGDWA